MLDRTRWDATTSAMTGIHGSNQLITTRNRGDIPGCVLASDSFKPFDAEAYDRRLKAFCREVRDYIAHMDAVRAGIVAQNEAEG